MRKHSASARNIYELGLGTQSNIHEAIRWYQKSSEQGYGVASNNLGTIYYSGREGIDINRTKASEWYQKAFLTRIYAQPQRLTINRIINQAKSFPPARRYASQL